MEGFRKPQLEKRILELRGQLHKPATTKSQRWQVWKIHEQIHTTPDETLLLAELSDKFHTIPAILPMFPTVALDGEQPPSIKLAEGAVILSKSVELATYWMVPEEKIGCYLRVHEYQHFTDGTSIISGLPNINHNTIVREWLNEVERQSSSMSDGKMQDRPQTLDQIKRSMSQHHDNGDVSEVSEDINSQMDLDDAHMLLSLADETQSVHDKDQEELSAQVKRTKLDNVDDTPAKNDSLFPGTDFGWSSHDYVTDVECIIPSDQERILSMLDGWNVRSSKGVPTSTASSQSSVELPSWSTAVLNVNTSLTPQLVKLPFDVECLAAPDYEDPANFEVEPSPGLKTLIKKFIIQRNTLYTSFMPSNTHL